MLVNATENQEKLEAEVKKAFMKNGSIPAMTDESNNHSTRIADFSDVTNDIKIENLLNLELVG